MLAQDVWPSRDSGGYATSEIRRFKWGESPIIYPGATVGPLAPTIGNRPVMKKGRRFYDDGYNAEISMPNPKEDQPDEPSMPR